MTHCRICGVLEEVGEIVICEDCADKLEDAREQVLNEAIALFDNGNYNGQTVKKMLQDLKGKP